MERQQSRRAGAADSCRLAAEQSSSSTGQADGRQHKRQTTALLRYQLHDEGPLTFVTRLVALYCREGCCLPLRQNPPVAAARTLVAAVVFFFSPRVVRLLVTVTAPTVVLTGKRAGGWPGTRTEKPRGCYGSFLPGCSSCRLISHSSPAQLQNTHRRRRTGHGGHPENEALAKRKRGASSACAVAAVSPSGGQ